MITRLLFAVFLFLTAICSSLPKAISAEIPIGNHSFEEPLLGADGAFTQGFIPAWTGSGTFHVYNPQDSQFSGTSDGSSLPSPIDGMNATAINDGAMIYQDLNAVVQPNHIYTLTFLVGRRIATTFGNSSVRLLAGGEILAEAQLNPTEDSFIGTWITYTSPYIGNPVGSNLRIEISCIGLGAQAWFDDFQLFVEEGICTPHRAFAVAEIDNGLVVGATVVDKSCGYTSTPAVIIRGGGGLGAQATAVVTNGQVTAINITNPGCCYTSVPDILIAPPQFEASISISVSKVKVTMNLVLGNQYILESKTDSMNWTATGPPFIAESETMNMEFDVGESYRFFRLVPVP